MHPLVEPFKLVSHHQAFFFVDLHPKMCRKIVEFVHNAGLAQLVVQLKPIIVVKG